MVMVMMMIQNDIHDKGNCVYVAELYNDIMVIMMTKVAEGEEPGRLEERRLGGRGVVCCSY